MPPETHTLAELLHRYDVELLCYQAPATQYHHRLLYRWLTETYGDLPLSAITPAFCREWRELLRTKYTPGTVRVYMAVFGAALTAAVEEFEWLPVSPLRTVRKPPAPPARVRFLSLEEQARLLTACQQSRSRYLHLIVCLALVTGARKNELCGLQWPAVDVQRGILRLERTKNKERRPVPVVGFAHELLKRHAASRPWPWVFPRADGQKPVLIEQAWCYARHKAGLDDFHFHDLRHTAASYLAMSGASLREIAEILGHSRLQHTMKYAHLTAPHTRGVVERMVHQFLRPQTDGPPGEA